MQASKKQIKGAQKELIDYITRFNIEWSLETTCKILLAGDEEALQNTWIALLAKAGEVMSEDHVKVWLVVCEDVMRQLQQDYLDAAEVLVLTVMFCLLFHRLKGRFRQSLQIQSLRSKIVQHFPDEAELTERGVRTYARILPRNTDDVPLAHKILGGLTSIWGEGRFEDSRMSLEYLSRRKLIMDLPGEFPFEMQDDDIAWFLWGALLCYYKEHEHVHLLWSAFLWDWKRSVRGERLGLLWGAAWAMHPNSHNTIYWNDKEMHFLKTIQGQASKLWLDYVQLHQPPKRVEQDQTRMGRTGPTKDMIERDNPIFDFTPRVERGHYGHDERYERHEREEPPDEEHDGGRRTIEVSTDRRRL